jgi:hypothetical protein
LERVGLHPTGDLRLKLSLAGTEVGPGDKVYGSLNVGRLSFGLDLEVEYVAVTGRAPGPVLYVGAGQHGDEVSSVLAASRLARMLGPDDLRRGAVIIVPVSNPVALLTKRRQGLVDGLDMNRTWPGDTKGNLTERVAAVLFQVLVSAATHVVDLHTAASDGENAPHTILPPRSGVPGAPANWSSIVEESAAMARCFKTPFSKYTSYKPEHERKYYNHIMGELHVAAPLAGKPAIVVELGVGGRVDETMVKLGVEGVLDTMRTLGIMGEGGRCSHSPVLLGEFETVRAPRGGIATVRVGPGELVDEGSTVAVIEDHREVVELRSPIRGYAVRVRRYAVVEPGERIVVLAPEEGLL